MKELLSIVALVAVTCVATPVVVLAQAQYPPPVPTATADGQACFRVDGDVDGRFVPGRVDHGSDIIVSGPKGTAEAYGQIEVFIDNRGSKLGESQALEDGSFAYTLTLPAWVNPGHHRIIGAIEGCGESRVDLEVLGAPEVLGASLEAAGGDDQAAGGASVGSGVLPRTGISILSFILGASILVGIGALLLTARNRRGTRLDTSSEAGIALLDTGDFVPRRSGQRGR